MIRLRRFNARCYMSNAGANDFRVHRKMNKPYYTDTRWSRRWSPFSISGHEEKIQGIKESA
jgi:hypothetical protein